MGAEAYGPPGKSTPAQTRNRHCHHQRQSNSGRLLVRLFQRSSGAIARTRPVAEGISFARANLAAVAICDDFLPDGRWYDAAAAFSSLPDPPVLVVIGDDPAIVQEVGALGGFDALVRPLRESDVIWSVASAWHAWMKRAKAVGAEVPDVLVPETRVSP